MYTLIPLLRFLAATVVMIGHYIVISQYKTLDDLFFSGENSVYLFFIISGFIFQRCYPFITDLKSFLKRRFIRLSVTYYPAIVVAIVAYLFQSSIEGEELGIYKILVLIIASFTYNIELLNSWFSTNTGIMLFWSLTYEALFYLVYGLLTWLNMSRIIKVILLAVLVLLDIKFIYFVLGVLIALIDLGSIIQYKNKIVLFLISFVALTLGLSSKFHGLVTITMLSVGSIYLLSYKRVLGGQEYVNILGRASFPLYAFHMLVFYSLSFFFGFSLPMVVASSVISIGLSVLWSENIEKKLMSIL